MPYFPMALLSRAAILCEKSSRATWQLEKPRSWTLAIAVSGSWPALTNRPSRIGLPALRVAGPPRSDSAPAAAESWRKLLRSCALMNSFFLMFDFPELCLTSGQPLDFQDDIAV